MIYKLIKITFFVFLDVSGILLGIFLAGLGFGVMSGWQVPLWMGWFLLALGISAFFLHLGHYLDLKYMRWLFGSRYFIEK